MLKRSGYIMDRAMSIEENVLHLSEYLEEHLGWVVTDYEVMDDGIISFLGIPPESGCGCEYKFDICYCDGTCVDSGIPASFLGDR